jgi:hypothetical protein
VFDCEVSKIAIPDPKTTVEPIIACTICKNIQIEAFYQKRAVAWRPGFWFLG